MLGLMPGGYEADEQGKSALTATASAHCLKLTEYDPVLGSFSALKLSRESPNFPSTVLPRSLSWPAYR